MIRSLADLRRDQETILAAYRTEKSSAPVPDTRAATSAIGGGCAIGRVADVVMADETYGPHVLVVRQAWSGTPPVPVDAAVGSTRCYCLPGLTVDVFSTGDFVRMSFLSGAVMAELLY